MKQKKTKVRSEKKAKKAQRGSLCQRLREAAGRVAQEDGFEILDTRCSLMASMFVPNGAPKKRMAFSFTIVGANKK